MVTDEILHGCQVLLFSHVSERISGRVRNEVGEAGESLSANWQNIFSVYYHRIHRESRPDLLLSSGWRRYSVCGCRWIRAAWKYEPPSCHQIFPGCSFIFHRDQTCCPREGHEYEMIVSCSCCRSIWVSSEPDSGGNEANTLWFCGCCCNL